MTSTFDVSTATLAELRDLSNLEKQEKSDGVDRATFLHSVCKSFIVEHNRRYRVSSSVGDYLPIRK